MPHYSAVRQDPATPLSSQLFFNNLSVAPTFDAALDGRFERPLPSDWWVVVTDIVNSTQAITAGRYKDVNTVGGSVIMAAINLDRSVEIPYIFGGDGATLAIPPDLEIPMRQALLATQQLAHDAFGLTLRVAMIPVSDLEARQKNTHVAKYQQSPYMQCALLVGDGWPLAETWAKSDAVQDRYAVKAMKNLPPQASYEGFECRWQSVPSRRDHKLCLLVASAKDGPKSDQETLRRVLAIVRENFGDLQAFHPLTTSDLKLSFNPLRLLNEAKVRLFSQRARSISGSILKYVLKILSLNVFGTFLFRFEVKTGQVNWGAYKPDFIRNADFFKFDGTLKMILDSTVEKTDRLEAALEKLYQEGEIVYGLHRSATAILTCLVFSYAGHHAHFVDGDGGGYSMAAVALKDRRRQLSARGV